MSLLTGTVLFACIALLPMVATAQSLAGEPTPARRDLQRVVGTARTGGRG